MWFRVDDGWHSHPKTVSVSLAARGLWAQAGSWSSDQGTDGHVPDVMLKVWGATAKLAGELVKVRLWERTAGGYRFHQWTEQQPSAATVQAMRAAKAAGGVAGNHRRWHASRGVVDPSCPLCLPAPEDDDVPPDYPPDVPPDGSHDRSVDRSVDRSDTDSHDPSGYRDGTESHPNPPDPTRPDPTHITHLPPPPSPTQRANQPAAAAANNPVWTDLKARLHNAGIRPGGWTPHDDQRARELLATHGAPRLLRAALDGTPPQVLRGALTRWQQLATVTDIHDAPTERCPDHHETYRRGGTCRGCAADSKAAQAATP